MSSHSNESFTKILKLVFNDDLLIDFNFDGSYGKRPFKELQLNDLLYGKFFFLNWCFIISPNLSEKKPSRE